jgi:hydrogenase nickel incorporation protein HypA/HybF
MHEMSIAQNIVDIIGQYVPEEQADAVRLLRVRVGRMAGIVPDSLDFCFSAIVGGTPLGRARLDFEEVEVRSRCGSCGAVFFVEGAQFLCPQCGSADVKLISGTELQVVEIEVADEPGETA